jgi:hypothetical protein
MESRISPCRARDANVFQINKKEKNCGRPAKSESEEDPEKDD